MPTEITMPQLSDTMTEGTVIKWLKKEGDKVKSGEIIAEIETDKANMEMESFDAGTIALIAAKEGDKVKVGDRIAVLATGNEDANQVKQQAGAPGAAPPKQSKSQSSSAPAGASKSDAEMGEGPLERGRAQSRREVTQTAATRTPESIGREATVAASATAIAPPRPSGQNGGERMRISPLARRIAEERGIDLSQIEGTGPGGRITQQDVLGATGTSTATVARGAPAPAKESVSAKAHGSSAPLSRSAFSSPNSRSLTSTLPSTSMWNRFPRCAHGSTGSSSART
jgi:pyruvate dehydrogenase E2 component (dihydrolipoamide acetyltransferase)